MANYQVTIGYRAVITVSVSADSEESAKDKGLSKFIENERKKWFKRQDINLEDDTFGVKGVLNMDETWNTL
jgi:hypothetical protein